MTEQEVLDFYNEMIEHYGDKLVNYEHHPIQFAHQVKLYQYYKERKQNENRNSQ